MGHHDAGLILSRSQSRGGGTGCGNRPVKERDFQNDSIRPFRFVPSHFGCYHPLSFHRSTDSVILHQPVINRDGFMVLRKNHVFIGPASKIIFLRIYRIRGRHGFRRSKASIGRTICLSCRSLLLLKHKSAMMGLHHCAFNILKS